MTNEIISQKLDVIWSHLARLLEEMNLSVVYDEWPDDEDSKTTELTPVTDDS